MINIQGYSVAHGKNGEGGGGTTIIKGGNGNSNIPADLNVTSITAATGTINALSGISLNYNDGKIMYLACGDGQINKLRGNEINYALGKIDTLYSSDIETNTLKTEDLDATKAWIEELNSKYITTEYLTVTKQAHFFELIIDKVRAVGGTMMMTQAQAVVDYAKALKVVNGQDVEVPIDSNEAEYYDIFFLGKDENNNRTITNDWIVGDQAYCQSFNNVSEGSNYDVSNKYYWRLVTAILPDRYMNINSGAEIPLSESAKASVNSVYINTPTLIYNTGAPNDTTDYVGDRGWNTEAQEIPGLPQNPTWTPASGGLTEITRGTMTTTNTILGIQLTPVEEGGLGKITPKQFTVSCNNPNTAVVEKARINIGIYYVDGSSQWFPAPDSPQETYTCNLTTQVPVESVVITNADEVEWKLVHGIRLSNKYADGECDEMLVGSASIPSAGDNLTQLGYRWGGESDSNEKSRGNAIIIAAYKTPDGGTRIDGDRNKEAIKPPSYAQYEYIGSDPAHYFDLAHYRKTYMDSNGAKFIGEFYTQAGNEEPQPIENNYTHIAYMNTPDNSDNSFTTNPQGGTYAYIGMVSDANPEPSQNWQDYLWSKMPETKSYRLVDQGSQVYSKMDLDNQNNTTKTFYLNLKFKVMCVDGTSTRYMTMGEMRDWPKQFTGYNNDNGFYIYARFTKSRSSSSANYYYYKLALNNESGVQDTDDAEFTILFEMKNKYTVNWNNEIIIKLIEANIKNDDVQTKCYITDNNEDVLEYTHDTVSMPVSMLSSATMQILDDNISTLVAQGNTLSTLQQTSDAISMTVYGEGGPQGAQGGLVTDINNLTVGLEGVQLTASHAEETADGAATQVAKLSLKYDQISLSVTNMENGLSTTGININDGSINLQADKVTFSDSQGGNTDKIKIDPNTGTLHATNANISGIITATSGSINGDMIVNGNLTRIKLSPAGSTLQSWGSSIVGQIKDQTSSTDWENSFFLGTESTGWVWVPKLCIGNDGEQNGDYVRIFKTEINQQIYSDGGLYNILQGNSTRKNKQRETADLYGIKLTKELNNQSDTQKVYFGLGEYGINGDADTPAATDRLIIQGVDDNNRSIWPQAGPLSWGSGPSYEIGMATAMTLGQLKVLMAEDSGSVYYNYLSKCSVLFVQTQA